MSSSRNNTKKLKDVSHDHKIELFLFDEEADIRSCVACTQGIVDKWYYHCPQIECNYFLHKFCGDLPLEIRHALHPDHPLTLDKNARYRECCACLKISKGNFYWCGECKFSLDLICSTSVARQLKHYGHPHLLSLQPIEIGTLCNCCGTEHRGIFYQCRICVAFWIHQDCASFEPQAISSSHPHPLHFNYSSYQSGKRIKCEICEKKVDNRRSWYLECVPCKFISHVHCALFEGNNEVVDEEIHSEMTKLPWEDGDGDGEFGVVGLLNRYIILTEDEEAESKQIKISHLSHPEHELILQDEVPKLEDPYSGHQIPLAKKCNGCTRKISSPFFRCLDDCDFFLHKWCALIRSRIPQHHLHVEHIFRNLVQSRKPLRVDEVFRCQSCMELCNGFYFQCDVENCQYKVDLECALLPGFVVHKAHPFHLLALTTLTEVVREPSCCTRNNPSMNVYQCRKCAFNIHINCAMYPANISHRYDHENPFKLWYDRGAVEANYFYCESCEEFIEPKAWYYHSKSSIIGDQLMHPNCILQREHPAFPKFKSTRRLLQFDIHPHRLHLSPSVSLTYSYRFSEFCGYCENKFKGYENGDEEVEDLILSYNCWEAGCGFRLHNSCAKEFGPRDSTVEEYPDES